MCRVNDFTRQDLSRPNPSRLLKQLSALINFAKFREERMELYQNITLERDECLDKLAAVTGDNEALQRTLDELRVATRAQVRRITYPATYADECTGL